MEITIEKAKMSDFDSLYDIGKNTPELKVSDAVFMQPEEFKWCISNPNGIFLAARDVNRIVGFLYANTGDVDNGIPRLACLVYIAVIPEYRKRGIAQQLFSKLEKELKEIGVNSLYSWANPQSESVLEFLKKNGMKSGHKFVWMEKQL